MPWTTVIKYIYVCLSVYQLIPRTSVYSSALNGSTRQLTKERLFLLYITDATLGDASEESVAIPTCTSKVGGSEGGRGSDFETNVKFGEHHDNTRWTSSYSNNRLW